MKYGTWILSLFACALFCGCGDDEGDAGPSGSGSSSDTRNNLLYAWDFESGANPTHDLGTVSGTFEIVDDPLGDANKVLKCLLPQGEYRTEFVVGTPDIHYFYCDSGDERTGDEIWAGFRVLKLRQSVTGSNNNVSTFQVGPVQNIITYPGTTSSGHYQLQMNLKTDQWRIREYESVYNPDHSTARDLTAIDYAHWESFVIHCIFRSSSDALFEIWKNGEKIFSQQRKNGIPHDRTRIQFGLYIGAGNSLDGDLTCYFDDIRIGGREARFEDVDPDNN